MIGYDIFSFRGPITPIIVLLSCIVLAPFVFIYDYERNYITIKLLFPVWSGKAFRLGGKSHTVSSGISLPLERNMQMHSIKMAKKTFTKLK